MHFNSEHEMKNWPDVHVRLNLPPFSLILFFGFYF